IEGPEPRQDGDPDFSSFLDGAHGRPDPGARSRAYPRRGFARKPGRQRRALRPAVRVAGGWLSLKVSVDAGWPLTPRWKLLPRPRSGRRPRPASRRAALVRAPDSGWPRQRLRRAHPTWLRPRALDR